MANNNDSIGKTLFVVVALCLVCSVIVAGTAVGLKATQDQQRMLDRQRNLLEVSGLLESGMNGDRIREIYGKHMEARLIDLKTGQFVADDPAKFDMQVALRTPEQRIRLTSAQDIAGLRYRANLAEVYLVRDDAGKITQMILPISGTGLWSMMHAFVSIHVDGNTIKGLSYYDQGETPGLGAEVTNIAWRQLWVGRKLFDDAGKPAIHVTKGPADPNDPHAVDGLSGATLTSRGVQNSFHFWLGDMGYGPFLRNVREGLLTHEGQKHG